MSEPIEPIPLPETVESQLELKSDTRPRIPEPPPVRLLTIEDARLICAAGLEKELDAFYKGLLRFERAEDEPELVYRAENFSLRFNVIEPPAQRTDMRPVGMEVPSLIEIEHRLIEAEIEYTVEKSITPGKTTLLLRDPAGNWIELGETARIS